MSPSLVVDSAAVWPADAMDVDEAVVIDWWVGEGAHVEAGRTICTMQIEKVDIDVPMPETGTVERILVSEDEVFRRGDALAEVRVE